MRQVLARGSWTPLRSDELADMFLRNDKGRQRHKITIL